MQSIWQNTEIGDPLYQGLTLGGFHVGTPLLKADYPGLRAIRVGGVVTFTESLPASYPIPNVSSGGVVIGGIQMFAGSAAPTGWLICNGASLLRADYAALFSVIGTTYGSVDATHFTLPDLRTKFPVGVGTGYALAGVGGAASVTLAIADIPTHNHTLADHVHPDNHNHDLASQMLARGAGGTGSSDLSTTGTRSVSGVAQTQTRTGNTGNPTSNPNSGNRGGDGSHENRPPYLALNFIIAHAGAAVELLY